MSQVLEGHERQRSSIGGMFNSSEYSDCQVVLKSGTILYLHKTIICSQNDFFKKCFASGMLETEQNKIIIEDDDDERILTLLIKSMYTAQLETNTDDLIDLIYSQKNTCLQVGFHNS